MNHLTSSHKYMYNKRKIVTLDNTKAEVFMFDNGTEVKEYHVAIHVTTPGLDFGKQLNAVLDAYEQLRLNELRNAEAVLKRYYISDAANQAAAIYVQAAEGSDCALSVVQQPPLDGTKVALWAYLQTNMATGITARGLYKAAHGQYTHLWDAGAHNTEAGAELQTRRLLTDYVMQLAEVGCNLADNCIRTWFFVNDVDINYGGVVKARNDVFHTQGLTDATHFIASTGIGGRQENANVAVLMDDYAIKGIEKRQISYLYAPSHLNRTSDYGVSFERGTCVKYGDRRHVFISGTASIDNHGEIVHPGDITKQTERMLENVEALLREAGCGFADVAQMTVYLRDTADYAVVEQMFSERFYDTPRTIVNAPVCRPGWLIEMECIAVSGDGDPRFATF